jgi:hypothetical protein
MRTNASVMMKHDLILSFSMTQPLDWKMALKAKYVQFHPSTSHSNGVLPGSGNLYCEKL